MVGLSVNLAKHADFVGQADKALTLIMAGAEHNTLPDATTPYICNGSIFDISAGTDPDGYPPGCPPFCISFPWPF